MQVIRPIAITDSMLVSSSVPETDYAAWLVGNAYAIGDRVIADHRVWEALQVSTGKNPATDATDPPYWLEVGSTNRWRMFDETVNSLTTAANSIVVEVAPGAINAVAVVEMMGSSVRVELFDGATRVYDQTKTIDGTPIDDWYEYFFEPYDVAVALVFEDVPTFFSGRVRVTITGDGQVGAGSVVFGTLYELGDTVADASAGITDFSTKTTNTFGVTSVLRRAFSKRSSQRLYCETKALRRLQALLSDLRATPCLWIGEEDTDLFAPLVVYGFYRDFQIEIPGSVVSFCSLEIEGMI